MLTDYRIIYNNEPHRTYFFYPDSNLTKLNGYKLNWFQALRNCMGRATEEKAGGVDSSLYPQPEMRLCGVWLVRLNPLDRQTIIGLPARLVGQPGKSQGISYRP
jgi:hypothetical protein